MSPRRSKLCRYAGLALMILTVVWCVMFIDIAAKSQAIEAELSASSSTAMSSSALQDIEQLKVNILRPPLLAGIGVIIYGVPVAPLFGLHVPYTCNWGGCHWANIDLSSALKKATSRETWRSVVDMATLKKSLPWEEKEEKKKKKKKKKKVPLFGMKIKVKNFLSAVNGDDLRLCGDFKLQWNRFRPRFHPGPRWESSTVMGTFNYCSY